MIPRRPILSILLIIFCLGLLAAPSLAQSSQAAAPDFMSVFQRANQAMLAEDFTKAVEDYQRLVDAGLVHPDLYFNLATAFYRQGSKGLAVLFYEKTLDLKPADDGARSNLEKIRKELIDKVVMPKGGAVGEPLWQGFIRGLSWGWLTWSFLGMYLFFFVLLAARYLMSAGPGRRLLFWISVPLLMLTLVFGSLLASRIYVQERVHHGVVVAHTGALRAGPERSAKVLMEVHEGLKVLLLNEVDGHLRVRLANGVEGFLADGQVGRI